MEYLITADCHGRPILQRLDWMKSHGYEPENTGLIILGDVGLNFYLNSTDRKLKREVEEFGYTIFCVRGNHEMPPDRLENIQLTRRAEGEFLYEPDYPHIFYFQDGGVYNFNGRRALCIGGAYSVDKYYRLERAGLIDDMDDPDDKKIEKMDYKLCAKAGWFKDEQLSPTIINYILERYEGATFDFILTHTCPLTYLPTDLFLKGINQSRVDIRLELDFDEIVDCIHWRCWLFGHYHADRIEAPGVYQLYQSILPLEEIYKDTKDHWSKLLPHGPKFNNFSYEI